MVTCDSCGSANSDEAKICNSCGAPLAAAAMDAVGAEVPPDTYITPEAAAAPEAVEAPVPVYPPPAVEAPVRPTKERSLALILEILPGIIGILGIGWIYAGNTLAGIIWLVAYLVWNGLALLITVFTLGIGAICWVPINIACIAVSAIFLNKYANAHSERFG